ncbi:hypothetical protein LXL04_031768 [Taraxacum kok-saghyz]
MAENDLGVICFESLFITNGTFVRHPCGYVGGDEVLFPNTHWAGMTVQECYQLIEDRTDEPVEKLYYCVPGMPLSTGIRWIDYDVDYAFWLDTGEENGEIAVYADNSGMALDEWWDEDMNLAVSEDESGLEDDEGATEGGQSQPQGGNGNGQSQPQGGNRNGQSQSQGGNGNGQSQPQGPVDEIEHDDIIPMDKTKDDAFLSKLCPSAVDNDGNNSESDEELENYAIFNEEVHWKKQVPILGMRFQSRKQLKNMLCNYAVANGYQLCFKKNDTKRLLVLCCKGECHFRSWATWMPETTFTPLLPPKRRKMPGRPAVKRKRGQSENVGKHRVSKMGKSVGCGACHIPGHNRTTCPNTNSTPSKLGVKRAKRTNNNQEEGSTQETVAEEAAQEAVAEEVAQETVAKDPAQEELAQEPVAEEPAQEEPPQAAAPIARPPRVRTRRPSERIIKKKLARSVIGKNGEGNSSGKPVELE